MANGSWRYAEWMKGLMVGSPDHCRLSRFDYYMEVSAALE